MSNKPLRMYIFVKQSLPSHKMVAVAHGVLMAHREFKFNPAHSEWMSDMEEYYEDWLTNSFRKVVCEVTDEEFEELKQYPDKVTVTESGLGGMECAHVFCPRPEWPTHFKQFKFSPY
jgi:peptidyl-tRNA hydrolase